MQSMNDLQWHYHDAASPLSFVEPNDYILEKDVILPKKSENQKEMDRYEGYLDFADKAKSKLVNRNLWVPDPEEKKGSAKPDAGERLKENFSTVLTSFVNLGRVDEAEKSVDRLPWFVFASQLALAPITVTIFAFNTVVSHLKKAFPSQKCYFDQAGKLAYYLVSTVHSVLSSALNVVSSLRSVAPDPVLFIIFLSIELLLGFFAALTSTEASLADQCKKREHLTDLINAKAEARSFFEKARAGIQANAEEAIAYVKFMTSVGKLDELSAESKFGHRIAATVATKECLWFGGAVVGNETAYKNLAYTEIAVSGAELAVTTLTESFMSLVANIIDLVQGVVVSRKSENEIKCLNKLKKQLHEFSRKMKLPAMTNVIKGFTRIIGKKIDDKKFENRLSKFRGLKALALIVTGIAGIVMLVLATSLLSPYFAIISGAVLTVFFVFLAVKWGIGVDNEDGEKKDEESFKLEQRKWSDKHLDKLIVGEEVLNSKVSLLHALSVSLIDLPDIWEEGSEAELLLAALNFRKIEIVLLKTLAKNYEAQAEDDKDYKRRVINREKNIELVRKELTRMMELKLAGA